ncbi:MAG: isopentenyl phosphate kinase [Thermoplasmata archaeon]
MPEVALTIVKLGGSVITRKKEVERVRLKVLNRLATEVAASHPSRLILLHGAGSFGHPGAHRFGLAVPPSPTESRSAETRRRGAAIVSAEVRRLHLVVLSALLRAGISPWSVPIALHARSRAGVLTKLDSAPFVDALTRLMIPVSFGDVVPDDEWGFSILSADTIARELTAQLHARRVIFVSDVEGILRTEPGGRRRAIPDVSPEVRDSLRPSAGASDVTGGIRGKADAMLAISKLGADAGLISGLTDGALSRAIRGEAVYGSWAKSESP